MKVIKTDAGNLLEEYSYGSSLERNQKTVANGDKTYYSWSGNVAIAEYNEPTNSTSLNWSKSYVYVGKRLLSAIKRNGNTEAIEYFHQGNLGTRLVTDTQQNTAKENSTLPFGTTITAESNADTSKKYESFDRSEVSQLDFDKQGTYVYGQGRGLQAKSSGLGLASLFNPQQLNSFSTGNGQNNPIGAENKFWRLPSEEAYKIALEKLQNEACSLAVTGRKDGAKQLEEIWKNKSVVVTNKAPAGGGFDQESGGYKINQWASWGLNTHAANLEDGVENGEPYQGIFLNPNAPTNGVIPWRGSSGDIRYVSSRGNETTAFTILHELVHWFGTDRHGDDDLEFDIRIANACYVKWGEKKEASQVSGGGGGDIGGFDTSITISYPIYWFLIVAIPAAPKREETDVCVCDNDECTNCPAA